MSWDLFLCEPNSSDTTVVTPVQFCMVWNASPSSYPAWNWQKPRFYMFVSVPLWRPWTSCQSTLGRIFVGCPLFRGPPQCYRSSPIIDTGSQHASLGSQHASLGSPRAKKCFLSVQNYRFQQLWFTSVVAFLFQASSAGFWGLLSHFMLPYITSLADPGIYYAQ